MKYWLSFLSFLFFCVSSFFCSCEAKHRFNCKSVDDCLEGYVCTEELVCVPGNCTKDPECSEGRECVDYFCMDIINCDEDEDCDEIRPFCDLGLRKCVDCLFDCTGKCCGDNGCGGECSDLCSLTEQSCNETTCECEGECVPDCEGKECGKNGCGGFCEPGCLDTQVCTEEGRCSCVSGCKERECGPDPNGCAENCGKCEGTDKCDLESGMCEKCVPDCEERECGPDGCDGVCSPGCSTDQNCSIEGKCISGCGLGTTRCTEDGYGYEACGPDPEKEENTFGERIPCKPDVPCVDGACQRTVCHASEVIFLLDRSSSMTDAGVWEWVKDGFENKMRERADLNYFGFRQFPAGEGCEVGEVITPSLGNADVIMSSVVDPTNSSATPIAKALDNFIPQYGDASDGQAVVLITDGEENCEQDKEVAIQKAGELFKKGIVVHVLAITTSANKVFLDRIAQAGGSKQSTLVTTLTLLEEALGVSLANTGACLCSQETKCENKKIYECTEDGLDWVYSMDCQLGCVDNRCAVAGELKWSFVTGGEVWSSPAIGQDGTIYLGSYDFKLYAIDPDGTMKWSFVTGDEISSSPAIGQDGIIYVGSSDYHLYAINQDGTMKWSFGTGYYVLSSPAIAKDGTVYVGSNDGNLYAVDPEGTMKWSFPTSNDILSAPAIGRDGIVYVGSYDKNLYAINSDGNMKWSFVTGNPVFSSPAIELNGTVYTGSIDKNLYAVDPDGTMKWSFGTGYYVLSSPSVGQDGTVYVGSWDYYLYAIDSDGTMKWSFGTGNTVQSSPAIGQDGTIYVGSVDGNLYAIFSESMGLVDSPWPKFCQNNQNTGRKK